MEIHQGERRRDERESTREKGEEQEYNPNLRIHSLLSIHYKGVKVVFKENSISKNGNKKLKKKQKKKK